MEFSISPHVTSSPVNSPKDDSHTNTIMVKKSKKTRIPREPLPMFYAPDKYQFEIGIDEAGRGPLFGRLYVAAVVLPKDGSMNTDEIRDSKKISKKRLSALYYYILEYALAYHIHYIDASEIDEINIREAVIKAMHICAGKVIDKLEKMPKDSVSFQEKYFLMVDGNDFPPYIHPAFSSTTDSCMEENAKQIPEFLRDNTISNGWNHVPYQTFLQGDNSYANIAAASILAKVARDNYVIELCKKYPALATHYGMHEHMGYGTKKHLDAIRTYGITQFHRKTYGCCKEAKLWHLNGI